MNSKLKKMITGGVAVLLCVMFITIPGYAHPRVTMSFTDAPVGYILQSLGKLYGANFSISSIASRQVISLELNDVAFGQALDMLSRAGDVEIEEVDSNLYVVKGPGETEAVKTEKAEEIKEQEDRLSNSVMETMTVKYTDVADVQESIQASLGEEYAKICSITRISGDENRKYNALNIRATNQKILNKIKDLIRTIDVEKPMVEIEAVFVEITKNKGKNTGMNWDVMTDPLQFRESGSGIENEGMDSSFEKYATSKFGKFWRISPWQFETTLQALKNSGAGRVLANPSIRVKAGRRATFSSETQVPYFNVDDDDVETEWKNVGIALQILPVVLDDDRTIDLTVTPRSSSIIGEKNMGDTSAPIIAERKVETELRIMPGETMVIGGLINESEICNDSAVPVLSEIPLFGELFKSKSTEKEESTVVVFLRPSLVKEGSSRSIQEYNMLKKNISKDFTELQKEDVATSILEKVSREEPQEKVTGEKAEKKIIVNASESVDSKIKDLYLSYSSGSTEVQKKQENKKQQAEKNDTEETSTTKKKKEADTAGNKDKVKNENENGKIKITLPEADNSQDDTGEKVSETQEQDDWVPPVD